MNERILEAAFQSLFITKRVSDGSYFIDDPELMGKLEKFAELIVRECISKCDGNGEYKNHTDTEFGQGVAAGIKIAKAQIQIHFGVEE